MGKSSFSRAVAALREDRRVLRIVPWLAARFMQCLFRLLRVIHVGRAYPESCWAKGERIIVVFWHGRLLMMPYCWSPRVRINMLISTHVDGRLIARTVSHFGIDTVAGSSSKGGTAALRAIVKALKAGECVGFTPDGPRGPRMRASAGVVNAARLAGVPILPCTYATARRRKLGSWDRFVLAWPFSRGVFLWGTPIDVPQEANEHELERARRAVEDSLNALSHEADRLCGTEPIEPDPESAAESAGSPADRPMPGRAAAGGQ